VALVGPSGSGKSSIAALLLRLYEPTGGRILVDGQPLGDQPADAWRRRVAAVMQEPGLMSGSIADNIRCAGLRLDARCIDVGLAVQHALCTRPMHCSM
jgi:ABC-type multidrug transport system fused ATPase/permease subunit